ncbi:MAG: DNA-directed RNA polymerase subunit omega [Deltaproteobacteria bacterium]|nr:DNA-directed RNA polymerase subunit omega [Deltaproteobacteria bacterium]MBW2137012.1 DNA-directed RNA polymerase subunit omega [Deltaproteobacteria bacterium]
MARITVEDCLKNVDNRFTLIHMAAKRVRQLRRGAEPTIVSKNKDIVVSLREIASGNIKKLDKQEIAPLQEGEGQPPQERAGDLPGDASQETEEAGESESSEDV